VLEQPDGSTIALTPGQASDLARRLKHARKVAGLLLSQG
jgi:hypothetical protein